MEFSFLRYFSSCLPIARSFYQLRIGALDKGRNDVRETVSLPGLSLQHTVQQGALAIGQLADMGLYPTDVASH